MKVVIYSAHSFLLVLLQHGADPNIRNTDGKSALDLADPSAKAVLTGQSLHSASHFTENTHKSCLKVIILIVKTAEFQGEDSAHIFKLTARSRRKDWQSSEKSMCFLDSCRSLPGIQNVHRFEL